MSGKVIWITGLSGSGKTTLARKLVRHLPGAVLLDGDDLREVLGAAQSGFDAASRLGLALTYARLAALLAGQGLTVVVATISLFHAVHQWNRAHQPGYVEIFLDVPLEERQRRDPKGLYAAEKKRQITHMAGSETPVELPELPDITFGPETSPEEAARRILERIRALPQ